MRKQGHKYKKVLCLLLAMVLFWNCNWCVNLDVKAASTTPVAKPITTLSGNQRQDAVKIAKSQVGYVEGGGNLNIYGKELGYNGAEWCAYFVIWCLKKAEVVERPPSGSTTANITWFQNRGSWHNKLAVSWKWNENSCNGVVDTNYEPQPGDFVAIENNGSLSDGPDHTAFVVEVDNSWVYTVEGNIADSVVERKYSKSNWKLNGSSSSSVMVSGFGEIKYSGNDPKGIFDSVTSEKGTITVSGWAFDRDDLNLNLAIHIYVGGPAGSGAPCYPITANKYRKDVADVYPGVGNYHGFAETIKVSARGETDVYVYAINNEKDQHNPLLGKKTVKITNEFSVDFEEEVLNVISGENEGMNIRFTGDGIGYIKCQVEDTEVCSGKWENTDWTQGTTTLVISGKKAGTTKVTMLLLDSQKELLYQKSFDVTVNVDKGNVIISSDRLILNTTNNKSGEIILDFSDCKNVSQIKGDYTNKSIMLESCEYDDSTATFVYTAVRAGTTRVVYNIIDTYGNVVGTINAEIVVQQPVTSIVLDKSTLTLNKSENYTLTGTVTPSNANNKTISWRSSDTSVATVDSNGLVKAVGKGDATITAIATDGSGVMAQCKVKVTEEIQEPIYRFADVSEGTWQYNVAKHTVEAELMKGKSNTADGLIIFDPNNNMTRAEFVQTLYNKEGKPAVNYTATFKDVPAGQWYTNAILWAAQNNIVAGKGEIFDVSGNITRQEMATILYKYATNFKRYETAGRTGFDGYVDAGSISNWATENMKWAIHYGIMKGQGNKLAPQANATRAECAAMLKNFMDIYE